MTPPPIHFCLIDIFACLCQCKSHSFSNENLLTVPVVGKPGNSSMLRNKMVIQLHYKIQSQSLEHQDKKTSRIIMFYSDTTRKLSVPNQATNLSIAKFFYPYQQNNWGTFVI